MCAFFRIVDPFPEGSGGDWKIHRERIQGFFICDEYAAMLQHGFVSGFEIQAEGPNRAAGDFSNVQVIGVKAKLSQTILCEESISPPVHCFFDRFLPLAFADEERSQTDEVELLLKFMRNVFAKVDGKFEIEIGGVTAGIAPAGSDPADLQELILVCGVCGFEQLEECFAAPDAILWRVRKNGIAIDLGNGESGVQFRDDELKEFLNDLVRMLNFRFHRERDEARNICKKRITTLDGIFIHWLDAGLFCRV